MDKTVIEEFYEQLESLIKMTKKRLITLILDDLNAKVGRDRVGNIVGNFGLGRSNDRGHCFIRFYQERDILLTSFIN